MLVAISHTRRSSDIYHSKRAVSVRKGPYSHRDVRSLLLSASHVVMATRSYRSSQQWSLSLFNNYVGDSLPYKLHLDAVLK